MTDEPRAAPIGPIQNIALTVGALLGTLCVLAGCAAVAFGLTPLVFRSGSMAPAIETGSLGIGHRVSAVDVAVGDVVSVTRQDGARITHRVVGVGDVVGNSVTLTLKGDANVDPDAESYVVTEVVDVVADMPYVGYFVGWLSTPTAWITGGLFAAWLLWVAFRPAPSKGRHARGHSSSVASIAVATAIVSTVAAVVGMGFGRADFTEAALTDTVVGKAIVLPATPTRPASFRCRNAVAGVADARLSWPAIDSTSTYRIVWTVGANSKAYPHPAGASGSTIEVSVPTDLPLTIGLVQIWTVSLFTTVGNFASTPALTRQVSVLLSVPGASLGTSCFPIPGVTTSSTSARSARTADPTTVVGSTSAPETTATATTTTTSTPASPTTTSPTTTNPTTATSTTEPSTTTIPSTSDPIQTTSPPTTTTPPPPTTAFVQEGESASANGNTASVSGGQLTVTDGVTTTPYTGAITTSDRYGTGVIWGSDGSLYVLSESGTSRITPVGDGTYSSTTVSADSLPPDILALR